MAKAKTKRKKPPSKKKHSTKKGGGGDSTQKKIAQLDRQLVKLINERAKLFLKAAERSGLSVAELCSGHAGEELLVELAGQSKGPFPAQSLRAVLTELLSGCRALVREQRIAFLGPLYSYSHLAAIHRFGQSVDFVPVGSIAAVFEEVNRGHCDFGLVPVENSTDGRIADTLDMFTRLPVKICGEVEMQIHHTLLGKCSRAEVTEVYSRPQALSQCRNWLAKHLSAARTIEVTSTSTAAQLAREKPGAAAVASFQAGAHYGLDILAERIEDNPANTTRFAVIGDQTSPRTGDDRTAMLFQIDHRPGALAEALNVFKRNRLNLNWIESFPIPGPERSYLFFVETEAHESEARLRRTVDALRRKTLRLEVLGSFPATEVVSS